MVWCEIASGTCVGSRMPDLGLKLVPHFSTTFARPAPIRLPEVPTTKKCEPEEKVIWAEATKTILEGSTLLCCPKDAPMVHC